ncbi:MAG: hypothetical protein HGA43_09300 [Nitrospirae bacterium]|nr:hypothetical protein [Nitrospirota bacterium]
MTHKDRLRLGEEFLIEKRYFLLHNEKQKMFHRLLRIRPAASQNSEQNLEVQRP